MSYLPFSTGDEESDLIACFILYMPRVDWFKQNVVSALSELIEPAAWVNTGSVPIEQANEWAAKMVEGLIVANFDPLPIGRVEAYAGIVTPDGWLLCDGSALSTTTYEKLFLVIGYTYGGSGGSFNLPDLTNRTVVMSGGDYALGANGGAKTVTLSEAEMPAHIHTASGTGVSDLGHSHGEVTALPNLTTIGAGAPQPTAIPGAGLTAPASANLVVTDPLISSTGGGEAHENMPPFIALNYIIYAGV
jgi:microcystin-dependent protein